MCCFSQPVEHVSKTRIFARTKADGRQLLVYSMRLVAGSDLAMVLPIPTPPRSDEDAVRFVDMSACPTFFDQLDALFPEEPALRSFGGAIPGFAPQPARLIVHDVGEFEASFVPTRADFSRLDERFRLPPDVWDALPAYADWGFCVFKLRSRESVPPALKKSIEESEPRLLDRVRDIFSGARDTPTPASPEVAPAIAPRDYHPMAFEFPRRDARLFFPTVHVHDGEVHATAEFDHTLYAQTGDLGAEGWRVSSAHAGILGPGAREWVDEDDWIRRARMTGSLPNRDVTLELAR
ncbi:MAG: hypothetical protein KC657_34485 [Myxococcales bacterium]|nr:hypothetical protein [Myxococcales bacterium]